MKSGPRDDLITIERFGITGEDSMGAPIKGWTSYATAWAQVVYGTGQERREAGLEGADQTANFRVLADTETRSVTVADRIILNGDVWDITSPAPLDRDGIEWTAIRRASA